MKVFLLVPFTAFLLHWIVQKGYRYQAGAALSQKIVALIGLLNVALWVFFFSSFPWWYVAIVAFSFSLVYVQLFNMSETARRIRIMTTLFQGGASEGTMTQQDQGQDLIARRVQRLKEYGSLEERDGRYYVKPGLILLAAYLFQLVRRIFYGEEDKPAL